MNVVLMIISFTHCCKGKSFQKKFALLGEVRSLITKDVRVMALTTTATAQIRKLICKLLVMTNPVIVTESPSKANIKYLVERNPGTLEETFASLVEEVP